MGKIRVKTIGDEQVEQQDKKKAEIKRAEKKARSESSEQARETAQETGESPESNEQKAQANQTQDESPASQDKESSVTDEKPKKSKKSKFAKVKKRSANYLEKAMEVDKNKDYRLSEAIPLLRKVKTAKFDETVELHINTTQPGVSGMVKLPHGTGKEVRVAIAEDNLIAEVEKGKINFDVLIAEPQMMPRLAKIAKILGPKGLMPNPKNGTISSDPKEAAKKFQGGQISFKTEAKNPLLHVSVGKTSFSDSQLSENIEMLFSAVKKQNIASATLKSTMSPGIKLQV